MRKLFLLVLILLPTTFLSAEIVVLQTGKTLSVQGYSVDGTNIHLTLNQNSEMTIPVDWVQEIRPSPPQPKPEPVPAQVQAVNETIPANWEFAYSELVLPLAQKHEIDWRLVTAVMAVESNFNPNAVSPKGARGLMQLMPATARLYNTSDMLDPTQNLEAGIQHLKMLMQHYQGNLNLVLAAYNAGEKAVTRYGGIPPYRETQDYVKKVLRLYQTLSS